MGHGHGDRHGETHRCCCEHGRTDGEGRGAAREGGGQEGAAPGAAAAADVGEGFGAAGVGFGRAAAAGAAIAAGVMLLATNRERLKPVVKGTLKEYYRFSDWLGANVAQVKEDLSDMAAEARHDYEQELAAHLELLEKERQVVQRLASLAKKRSEEA